MNKKLIDVYLNMLIPEKELIYQWNQKQNFEHSKEICKRIKNCNQLFDVSNKSGQLIWQATYFDKVDDIFEDWFSNLFDNFIEECKLAAENNQDYQYFKNVKISEIMQHLPKNKIKNYKNMHNFIDILKNSNGYLTIQLCDQSNCYQPPINFISSKIKIKDRTHNLFSQPIDKAGQEYKSYMQQLTQKCKTLKQKYAKIKKQILSQENFGCIKINYKYFQKENEQLKKTVITHQFGHFLDYLIKINAENWDIGRQYRSHVIHSDFNSNNQNDRINYFLDQDQFQHLASTYIESLKIVFKNNCQNINDQNQKKLFLKAFMISLGLNKDLKNNEDVSKITNYAALIQKSFYFQDLKDFFLITYKDSLADIQNKGSRNKWTILKKWLNNQFKNIKM